MSPAAQGQGVSAGVMVSCISFLVTLGLRSLGLRGPFLYDRQHSVACGESTLKLHVLTDSAGFFLVSTLHHSHPMGITAGAQDPGCQGVLNR